MKQLLLLSFFSLSMTSAFTQNPDIDFIKRQLSAADRAAAVHGYYRIDTEIELVDDGGYLYHEVHLRSGMSYLIHGACDFDCSDLDVCIYDGNMNEIDCDKSIDDKPVVTFSVYRSGTFYLKVLMHDCELRNCYYGIALYAEE